LAHFGEYGVTFVFRLKNKTSRTMLRSKIPRAAPVETGALERFVLGQDSGGG
jgi:hypothetical protein